MKQRLIEQAEKFQNCWNEPVADTESNRSISIIIPVYFPEHLDAVLTHLSGIGGYEEIILVDDSGAFEEQDYSYLQSFDKVKLIYHKRNLGRPAARNTGAMYAKGDIFIFIDQDMFLDPDFIASARRYYYINDSMLFLGLRETVSFENIPSLEEWKTPDMEKDWRIQTKVSPDFVDLTVLNVGSAYNGCYPNETIHIAQATDGLKKMGISADKTLGFWDLPSMVVSHSMAIGKNDFFKVGGFPEWIQGWGGEDIVLGFLACSAHIPIYLSNCISYQAYHHPYSGSEAAKNEELVRNIEYYRKWAVSIEEFPVLQEADIPKRAQLYSEV